MISIDSVLEKAKYKNIQVPQEQFMDYLFAYGDEMCKLFMVDRHERPEFYNSAVHFKLRQVDALIDDMPRQKEFKLVFPTKLKAVVRQDYAHILEQYNGGQR